MSDMRERGDYGDATGIWKLNRIRGCLLDRRFRNTNASFFYSDHFGSFTHLRQEFFTLSVIKLADEFLD